MSARGKKLGEKDVNGGSHGVALHGAREFWVRTPEREINAGG